MVDIDGFQPSPANTLTRLREHLCAVHTRPAWIPYKITTN